MSQIIRGDNIVFENYHTNRDITLKHKIDGFDLIFQSECIFQQRASYQTIKLGNFTIKLSNDAESLEVCKNDNVFFEFTE